MAEEIKFDPELERQYIEAWEDVQDALLARESLERNNFEPWEGQF